MKIYFAFTIDYEIFLSGRSGKPEKVLVEPMEHLINIFRAKFVPSTLFIDCLYLDKLKEHSSKYPRCSQSLSVISKQLDVITRNKHELGLHIHTSWLNAEYQHEQDQWQMDDVLYRVQDVPAQCKTDSIEQIIRRGNAILQHFQADKNIKAFRAGGLCIEPFNVISEQLCKYNYTVDSSVAPNIKVIHKYYTVKFPKVQQYGKWRFSTEPLKPEQNGSFIEIPITTGKASFFPKLYNYLKYKNKHYDNSAGGNNSINRQKKIISKMKKIFDYNWLSPETLSVKSSIEIIKQSIKQQNRNSSDVILVAIIHPKVMQSNSIKNIETLINYLTTKYNVEFVSIENLSQL